MGIAVLQNLQPPILPNLQDPKNHREIISASNFVDFGKSNKMSLGEMVVSFFKKMAAFDYENQRISILHK